MCSILYKSCLFKSLDLDNKAENALWPLNELILFSDNDWWFIQSACSNPPEAKNKKVERRREERDEERRDKQEKGKQGVMEVLACQSCLLIHAETDAFDHSKSQAWSINT